MLYQCGKSGRNKFGMVSLKFEWLWLKHHLIGCGLVGNYTGGQKGNLVLEHEVLDNV